MKDTIVWESKKTSPKRAQQALAKQVERMEARGYRLERSELVERGRSKKSWLFLAIFNFMRSKQVQAIATFRRQEQPA